MKIDNVGCSTSRVLLRDFKTLRNLRKPSFQALVAVSCWRGDAGLHTARSAEVEPPGLGSKCGKRVERLSDF